MTDRAIILAGGRGTRLAPYTSILPKPLMPLHSDASIIEHVLAGIANAGIQEVVITLGYLGHLIEAVVGSGDDLGLRISYSKETSPLGTAGPIGLLSRIASSDRLLVVNGDTYTNLNFAQVLNCLTPDVQAVVTCVTRRLESNYGVVERDDNDRMLSYNEKPVFDLVVSTGIYAFRGSVASQVSPGERMDMPELLVKLVNSGHVVKCFLPDCEWMDLGRPEDFAELQVRLADSV